MKRKKISGGSLVMVPVIIASALLMVVLGQRQYVRMTTDEAWVARSNLNPGQMIKATDLVKSRVSDSDSAGTIANAKAIVGKQLKVGKAEGDAFHGGDFMGAKKNWMSTMVPEGRVIYTLKPDKALLPYTRQIRQGDRFDILLTRGSGQVQPLAYDVILLGTLHDSTAKDDEPKGRSMFTALTSQDMGDNDESGDQLLVLGLKPNHVFPLASAQNTGGRISFVVHGQREIQEGKRLSVTPKTRGIEIYSGLDKTKVTVRS